MANLEKISRQYEFTARTSGVDDAIAKTQRLGAATDQTAVETEKFSRASGGAQVALERHQRALDLALRSATQFESAQRDLQQAQILVNDSLTKGGDVFSTYGRNAEAAGRAVAAANNNAARALKSAGDESKAAGQGFVATASDVLQLATHLKLAVAAAYLISPAFRGIANATAGLVLRETVGAIAAISPAAASASVAIGSQLGSAFAFLIKLGGPLTLLAVGIKTLESITELGVVKFKELNDLASKATSAGIDVDLFQRIKLSAEDAGLSVDKATSTITRFSEVAAGKAGGSEIEKKLKELTDAGNMVGADIVYRQATSTADRYRIVVEAITTAMLAGERVAALDLAKTFAPAEVVERLKASGDALQRMQDAADKVSAKRLISPQDIAYAQDLKNRLDDSEKVLRERWFPIQNDLTNVALSFKETQIQINELLSLGAVAATALFDAIKGIPGALRAAGSSSFWVKVRDLLNDAGLISDRLKGGPGMQSVVGGIIPADSLNQLTAGLINRAAVQKAMLEANETAFSVLGDATKKPFDFEAVDQMDKFNTKLKEIAGSAGDVSKTFLQNIKLAELGQVFDSARKALENSDLGFQEQQTKLDQLTKYYQAARKKILEPDETETSTAQSGYDRLLQSIRDRISELQLEAQYASKAADAVVSLKVAHELERAATKSGVEASEELRAKWKGLGDQVAEATRALALAKVRADIRFENQALFLPESEVQIANKLKDAFQNDIPAALASSEAAAMRLNQQLRLTQDLASDALKSFLSDVRSGKAPLDAFANALTKISDKLTDKGLENLVKGLSGGGALGFAGAAANDNAQSIRQGINAAQQDAIAHAARQGGGYYGGSPTNNPNLVPVGGSMGGQPNYAMGALGALGAGVSSYKAGQAAGSPTQGALGGALTGAMAGAGIGYMFGGPIGALIGAGVGTLAGGLAGFFGGKSAAQKQQEDARKAWTDMAAQVAEMENLFTGKPFGDLTSAIRQSRDDLDKAMEAASKAGDTGAVNRLATEWNAFVDRKRGEFKASFGALLDAFNTGLGDNSPLVQAKANIVSLGEKLKGFVADAQQAFGGGDTAFGSFGAGAADAAVQIAQAQRAAQSMALAALDGVPPLSDVASKLLELRGTAQGLQHVLVDLGLSAGEAASAISTHLNAAIDKLRTDFVDNLTRDINAATGKGFLNDIGDLVKRFQQMQSDTVSLGADPSLLTRWLDVQAQKIINDAQLTGQAFDDLVVAFPFLQGNVTAFTGALTRSAQDIATAKQSFQDQLFTLGQDQSTLAGQLTVFDLQAQRAREDEVAKGGQALADLEALQAAQRLNVVKSFNDKMLEDTQRALEEAQNFIQGITRRIKEYLDGLKSGSESPLSPSARLSAAQTAYNTQLALSQTAGPNQRDALGGITQYADSLLGAAKSFYGSASGFQTIFNNIQTQLGALPSQISPEQFIVNAITTQTSALLGGFDAIDTNLDDNISFAEMQTALGSIYSTGTLRSIFNSLDANGNGLLTRAELQGTVATSIDTKSGTAAVSTTVTASKIDAGNAILNATLGGTHNLEGIYSNTADLSNNTIGIFNNTERIRFNTASANVANGIPFQAMGGLVRGPGTGTSDSIFAGGAWVSNGEFVVNAASTARNLPLLHAINDNAPVGFGDSGAVVKELRAVAAEIRRLAIMVGSGTELTAAVRDGVAQTAEITDKMVKLLLRKPKAAA